MKRLALTLSLILLVSLVVFAAQKGDHHVLHTVPKEGSATFCDAFFIPNGAKDAIQSLNTALKTLPSSAKLQSLLGDAYQKSGDAKSAKEAYEKALGFDTNAKLPDTRHFPLNHVLGHAHLPSVNV